VPIRLRLAGIVALVTLALVGVGGLLFDRQLHASVDSSIDDGLAARADPIVRAVRETPAPVDQASLQSTLIGRRESLAAVVDPQHQVVAASGSFAGTSLVRRLDALAPGASPHASTRELRGPTGGREETRILATPVARADGTWIVLVGTSLEPTELAFDRVHVGLLVGGLLGILAAAAGAWALARAALRPVESMRREVAALRSRSVGRVAAPRTRDEVAALATTLNDLLDQLQEARQLEQRLVADAGHELRTPLAVLRTELELAGRPDRSREELVDAVAHAAVEVDRLNRLADALLFLARLDEGSTTEDWPVAEPVEPVARAAVRAVAERADRSGVEVRVAVPPSTAVRCDPDRLRQALDNLLDNAVRAAPAGSRVTVSARAQGRRATISVEDEGPGFPTDFLPHAFERFSRADNARRGTGAGLGLAIVAAIARANGGTATAENRAGGGARVVLDLPGDAAGTGPGVAADPPRSPDRAEGTPGGRGSGQPAAGPAAARASSAASSGARALACGSAINER
jgi:signal transduction histidine kinase